MKTKSFYYLIIALLCLCPMGLVAQQNSLYENFDNVSTSTSSTRLPEGWDVSETNSTSKGQWWRSTTKCYDGTVGMSFNSNTAAVGTYCVLKTPLLNFTSDKILNFHFKNGNGGEFNVYVDEYTDEVNYTRHLLDSGLQASDWTYKSYKLDAYTNKNIKIAFKSVSNKAGSGSATSNHFLDNVIIEDVSLCAYPMNLELVSVSQNSASIMWTIDLDGGGYLPSAYRITVKDESENIVGDYDDFVFENDYSNYFVIEGLNSSSRYSVSLRSDCSEDLKGISKWSNVFVFKTLCDPASLPYSEKFDAEGRILPSCWIVNPDNLAGVEISTSGFKYGDTGYSLLLKGSSTKTTYVVTDQFAHGANDLEVSFMINGDYGLPFNVGLTSDPLSADAFEVIWEDTIDFSSGWHEVRFCTDATYYAEQENLSLFISLPAGVDGSDRIYIDEFMVKERPACPRLEKVEAVDVLATEATIGWVEFGKAGNYEYEISRDGLVVKNADFTSSNSQVLISGLEGNTQYSVRVRSKCVGTEGGEWSLPVVFMTACDVMESNIFAQSFEASSSTIPECWQVKQFVVGAGDGENYGDAGIDIYTPTYSMYPDYIRVTEAKDGNKVLRFRASKGGTRTAIITQGMQIDEEGAYDVSFWMYRHVREVVSASGDIYSEPMRVLVNNRPDTVGAIELDVIYGFMSHTPQVEEPGWYQYDYNIPLTGTVYFMLEAEAAPNGNDLFVDDIRVYPAPICRKISDIEMLPPTKTEFGMKWEKGKSETEWVVRYRLMKPDNFETIKSDVVKVSGGVPEFKLDGLTHSTEYRIAGKVASYCGVGDTSVWVDFEYKFQTACDVISTYPYEENFEGLTFPPVCWSLTGKTDGIIRHERSEYMYEGAGVQMRTPGEGKALVTPQFRFEANKEYRISFMMMRNFGDGGIKVMLNDTPDTIGAQELLFVPTDYLQKPNVVKKGYYQYKVDFDAVGDKYLLFVQTSTQLTSADDYIDKVIVSEKPACEPVLDFEVNNVTSYTAQVRVLDEGVTTCEVSFSGSGVAPNAGKIISSDSCVIEVEGLLAETTYDVYVRNVCGAVKGEWSAKKVTITTHCTPFAVTKATPFVEDFEGFVEAQQLSGCYLREGGYFRTEKRDATYKSMIANSGELYAWMSSGVSAVLYRPLQLKAGVYYELSTYAIQGGTSSHVSLGYSRVPSVDSLTMVVVDEKIGDEWGKHSGYFSVAKDGVYYFGVKVYAGSNIGLDDIMVQEVTCVPPTTGIANLTSESAAIKITDMTAGMWLLSVNDFAYAPEEVIGNIYYDTISTEYTDLTGLMSNKDYYYSVKSLCGDGDVSAWSKVETFRTRCAALMVPFTEDFEYDVNCWTFLGDYEYHNTITYPKHTGNYSLSASQATIITPEFDTETLADYMIKGWVRSTVGDQTISIGVMVDIDDVSTFEPIGNFYIQNSGTWYEFNLYFNDLHLDDYADFRGARYIAIYLPQEEVSFYFDDVEVRLAPTCKQPVEAKFTAVTDSSCTISWTSKGDEDMWKVVGKRGDNVVVDTIVTTNPAVINNLSHSTTYSFEMMAICSEGVVSEVTKVGTVTTECGVWTLPYLEDFKDYSYGAIPLCWEVLDNGGWFIEQDNRIFFTTTSNNKAGYKGTILTPQFDLRTVTGAMLSVGLANSYADSVTFRLSIDGGETYPIVLGSGYTDLPTYTTIQFDLTPYVGNKIRISIEGKASGVEGSYIVINHFELEEIGGCMRPVELLLKEVGGTNVKIEVTDTTAATAWEYVVLKNEGLSLRNEDLVFDEDDIVSVSTKTIEIDGLSGFTNYVVLVRTDCGDTKSAWRDVEFTTECAEVNSIPYRDGFEKIEKPDDGCFSIMSNKPDGVWRPATGISWSKFSEGEQSLQMFPSKDYPMYVVMPLFDVPTTSLRINFDYLSKQSAYYSPELVVGVIPNISDLTSFVEVKRCPTFEPRKDDAGNDIFESVTVEFNVLDAEYANSRIAIKVGPTLYDNGDACIDNIVIDEVLGCANVRSMELLEVGEIDARIVLDYQSAGVQLAYGPATQDIDSMARVVSVLDTVELTDLTKGENYVAYARSVCGVDTGEWIQPILFSTKCDVYEISDDVMYSESFNSYGDHPLAFPTCYTRVNSVVELGVEYPKLTRARDGEGDKMVLHLYKEFCLALPEFSLSGEKLMMVFNSYNPQGGTYYKVGLQEDLTDESTFVEVKEFYASTLLRQEVVDFSQHKVTGKYIVFKGTSKTSGVYIDNIVVSKAPECFAPTDLKVEVLGDTYAVLSWNQAPAAEKYEYELGTESGELLVDNGEWKLENLQPGTKYLLRMRAVCVEPTAWVEVEFTTMNNIPEFPYICGFEDAEENGAWIFADKGEDVKFIVGTNSNNSVSSGDNALYVADATGVYSYYDYGSANVYAYRTLLFAPGDYQMSFEWKCNGEGENDFGRVFLAPINIYVSAGTKIGASELDEKYIRLHESDKLSGSTVWKKENKVISVDKATNYYLIVQWSNDVSGAQNPPLAIDNIRIEKLECGVINDLSVLSVGVDSVVVGFNNPTEGGEVEYLCVAGSSDVVVVDTTRICGESILIEGLEANISYEIKVRPVCGDAIESPWTTLNFMTRCEAVDMTLGNDYLETFEGYQVADVFDNCWDEVHLFGKNSWLINSVDVSFTGATAYSGKNYMSLSSRGGTNKNRVVREFRLEGGKYYKVSVYARQSDLSAAYVSIIMGDEVKVREAVYNTDYQKISAEIYVAESGIYQLGIEGEVTQSSWNLLIDDFGVEVLAVGTPVDLRADAVTDSSVELSWVGNSAEYEVEVLNSAGIVVGSGKYATTSCKIEGLNASTSYVARVRSVYGNESSNWVEVTFNTACGLIYPPFVETFENVKLTEIPLCWDSKEKTSLLEGIYNWAVIAPDEYSYIGNENGRCVQIQCASTNGYATLRTPELMLDGDYSLMFKYINASPSELLKVVVEYESGVDTLGVLVETGYEWSLVRYDLSEYNGKVVRIGFFATASKGSSASIVVDDVKVLCYVDDVVYKDAICQPSQGTITYTKHGFSVNSSTLKVGLNVIEQLFEAQTDMDCDTLKRLELTMNPSGIYQYNDTICEGEVYNKAPFEGKNIVIEGYYDALLKSSCGCDSVVRLHLTVLNTNYALVDTICEGEVYRLGNQEITEAGIYVEKLVNSRGCDSIVTLTLSVVPKYFEEVRYVCEGDKVVWSDTTLTTTGRYEKVYINQFGCDSVRVMKLVVLPSEVEVYDTICLGESYQFVDTILTTSGLYERTFQNMLRCDSIVHLHLTVAEPEPTIENDYVCEGELYTGYGHNRIVITQDTMLIQRISQPDRCDSLVHIYVDFVEIVEVDTTVYIEQGDFYDFGENSLTKPGKYREVFTSTMGCDSIVNLTLEVLTGLENNEYVLSLIIAPNPVTGGEVTYINRDWSDAEKDGLYYEVIDATGNVVIREEPSTYPIAVSGLPVRGLYMIRVVTGTGDLHFGRLLVK